MNVYQNELIKEHSELSARITTLNHYFSSGAALKLDDKVEFANKLVQLKAMNSYKDALTARLVNAGIVEENGSYFERVKPVYEVVECAMPQHGNDYDEDNSSSPVEKCCDRSSNKNEDE